ncbi:MAG: hypothetical protein V9H69_19095 [Anaerolineae bacterium]
MGALRRRQSGGAKQAGKYSVVHPNLVNGVFAPQERDEAAGPDSFELQVGNFLAYSVPLGD